MRIEISEKLFKLAADYKALIKYDNFFENHIGNYLSSLALKVELEKTGRNTARINNLRRTTLKAFENHLHREAIAEDIISEISIKIPIDKLLADAIRDDFSNMLGSEVGRLPVN